METKKDELVEAVREESRGAQKMNRHENGTLIVGAPGSYRRLLSELEDLCKTQWDVNEFRGLTYLIYEEGWRIGETTEAIGNRIDAIATKLFE